MPVLKQSSTPSAFTRMAVTVMVAVFIAAAFVAITVVKRASDAQLHLQQEIVLRGADAIGLSFNTALRREWDSLNAVARNIQGADVSDINKFMDAVGQTGGQVAWSGVADLDGRIISGTNRLREGEDVSQRRWFREGLRGGNVGNVYSSSTLPLDGADQRQSLLNLSTPVFDAQTGEVTGVLVYSLRMAWVADFLSQARRQLQIDVVVKNRDGNTLVDTRDDPEELPDAVAMQAELGINNAGAFRLTAREEGLFAYSPNFISDALPDFGWRVFATLDRDNVTNTMPDILRSAFFSVTIAALFVLGATLLVARILLRPIEALTATAIDVAEGDYDYPIDSRSSKEAEMLSRALVRIQAMLASHQSVHPDHNDTALPTVAAGGARSGSVSIGAQVLGQWKNSRYEDAS
ncbi:hypothetical protein GCM10011415_26100 [Salipiger pallidus]|uniref:HAMP domain-containing protein n=1 Tax=Salipiger pallidus TaxID=1775170 RepID=A0A8J2ZL73_9RHOB|nr:cache and HAMP domain-containing protein [Salipiger pallidus]GGG76202.1 hypothetical protein GCM10011415_26100 [Salipiger pallidus]